MRSFPVYKFDVVEHCRNGICPRRVYCIEWKMRERFSIKNGSIVSSISWSKWNLNTYAYIFRNMNLLCNQIQRITVCVCVCDIVRENLLSSYDYLKTKQSTTTPSHIIFLTGSLSLTHADFSSTTAHICNLVSALSLSLSCKWE